VMAEVPSGSTTATLCYDADFYPFGVERPYTNMCSQNYKFTGKERDTESNLDNFGARYNSSAIGRFMSADPVQILKQKLVDPQQWNMYSYVRDSPLRFVDPRGKWIELLGDDDDRKKELAAIQQAIGKQAGSYLYDNTVTSKDENGNNVTKHYVGVYSNGPGGNGPSFGSINASSNKIGGIISDTSRGAQIAIVSPGMTLGSTRVGSLDRNMTPGATHASSDYALTFLTSGPIGHLPGRLFESGEDSSQTLGDVISHELGHVDSAWYHGDSDSNGDAVRQENQTRQMEGEPLRLGHEQPNDVQLNGPF
jgi:RHS repeat-associated protein